MTSDVDRRVLIVIGQVLSDPWLQITREGQFTTWLPEAARLGIPVRHSHARRPGFATRRLDRIHEFLRWNGRGRTLVPRIDEVIGNRFLSRVPNVNVGSFVEASAVAWQQDFPDVYALQRWKVVGSLTQAMKEDFDFVYFTTASSYVRIPRLLEVLAGLPATGVYAGTAHRDAISGQEFASGANRVLSRDVVKDVLSHKNLYRNDVMEDVGLGRTVANLGHELIPLPTMNISSKAVLDATSDEEIVRNFHFRMTSGEPDARQDAPLMLALHDRIMRLESEAGVQSD